MRFTPCVYPFFQFLPPAPCPSPFSASPRARLFRIFLIPHAPALFRFRFRDLRLTVFFDLLGIFCYDAVTSGFPL